DRGAGGGETVMAGAYLDGRPHDRMIGCRCLGPERRMRLSAPRRARATVLEDVMGEIACLIGQPGTRHRAPAGMEGGGERIGPDMPQDRECHARMANVVADRLWLHGADMRPLAQHAVNEPVRQ